MTMRITMIQSRMGEAGSVLVAGQTYTVSDPFGAAMVGARYATDTDRALTPPVSDYTPSTAAQVQALVSRAWNWPTTALLLGDSFSARVNSSLVPYRQSDHGYWTWANLLLGSPMRLVSNFGVAGETTTQILARVAAADAADAGYAFVQGGINDFSAGASVATVVTNLTTICETLRTRKFVVLLAVAPNSTSATIASKIVNTNERLRRYAATAGNVLFVDTFTPLVDSTSTTGALATGMSDDALHPSVKGARAMGAAIATALTPYMPTVPLLVSSAADSYAVDAGSSQILQNPLMSGSSGTVSGTGASGTIATGWSGGTDTGTVTNVWLHGQSRTDGVGVDQQVTISSAGSGAIVNMRQTSGLTARVTAGQSVYFCGSMTITGMADVSRIQPSLSITVGGTAYTVHCLDNSDTTFDQTNLTFNFRTPDFLLTDVPTVLQAFIRIRFGTSGAGAAVVKMGRLGVYAY